MENEAFDFDAFDAAMDDAGYQGDDTASEEAEVTEQETEESCEQEADGGSESGENSEEENAQDGQETGAGGQDQPEEEQKEQMFTLRVNKEDRQVGLAEMTALAQKGADYDRVKGQFADSTKLVGELQAKLDAQKDTFSILSLLSEESGIPMDGLADALYVSFRKENGGTEAEAKAMLRAYRAEQKNKEMEAGAAQKAADKEQSDASDRAAREVAEFRQEYPEVEITKELCDAMEADIRNGTSMVNAYRKYQLAQRDRQISDLQKKLAAEEKNRKNRTSSPGSQKDAGGAKNKTEFDIFDSVFNS